MGDEKKTKAQLITELEELRSRLNQESVSADGETDDERNMRKELRAEIKFIGDFGLIQAQGINLSEGGICFEVEGKIPFEMEFELEGETHEHRANLVWMSQVEQGRCQLGFAFVPPATTETSGLLWLYKELKDWNDPGGEEQQS